jgi:2-oxo-hept-3-ene-1,7-dioate hydratase
VTSATQSAAARPADDASAAGAPRATGRILSDDDVRACAARIHEAERSRQQIGQLSRAYPGMTIEDAYAVQRAWVDLKLAEGRRLIGHKIGLTSRAMQMSSQIDEPDFGDLLDDMCFVPGATIPAGRFIVPRVELELAFVLREPIQGPDCTLETVLAATARVIPAIEIIDARIEGTDRATGKPRRVTDTISDNAANAGLVLGSRAWQPREIDLRWVSALCYRNGVIEESGVSAAVLGHPAHGIAWLANKLAAFGRRLEPDCTILSGSFIRPVAAQAGDSFLADFGPLGSIAIAFA